MNAQRQHRAREAEALFARAGDALRETGDVEHFGLAQLNLGVARLDLQKVRPAATALHDALAIFVDLGSTGEIARTKGMLARVSMVSGRYEEAREMMTEARRMLLALEMPEEAGLAGLELVEIFLALRDDFRAVAVLEEVIAEFTRARLNARATTALAYLRDMIPKPQAAEAARHVRRYVAGLRAEPERVFAPLPASKHGDA